MEERISVEKKYGCSELNTIGHKTSWQMSFSLRASLLDVIQSIGSKKGHVLSLIMKSKSLLKFLTSPYMIYLTTNDFDVYRILKSFVVSLTYKSIQTQ